MLFTCVLLLVNNISKYYMNVADADFIFSSILHYVFDCGISNNIQYKRTILNYISYLKIYKHGCTKLWG